jgi:flagellar protein FliS
MIALARYAKTQTETASRERLMVMLFEKALRNLRIGAELIEKGRAGEAVYPLTGASDIVLHLRSTLDLGVAPHLRYLKDVYGFVSARATLAAIKRSAKLAREAEKAFAPVCAAFSQAVAEVRP